MNLARILLLFLLFYLGICHASPPLSDFITYMHSCRYVVKDYKDFGDYMMVILYDTKSHNHRCFLCDMQEPWVYPKFYPDQVVRKSEEIDIEDGWESLPRRS